MHITLEADYAIRIVRCLCRNRVRMDAKKISSEANVTLRFSLKILGKLVAGGVVKSFKGTQGGYELAREPEQISLKDVLAAVEGPYQFSRCLSKDSACPSGEDADCKAHKIFCEITNMVQQRLSEATFDQLV